MKISKRLKKIADLVTEKRIADIGTDHAYLPIYLADRLEKAIACDINEGPLKTARRNITAHELDGKVETRLGNGMKPIKPGEVDCAVISGMGGMQIVTILKESYDVTVSLRQLILQPQHDIPEVRRYIHSIGFKIIEEVIIRDVKYYNIIICQKGQDLMYNEVDYLVGKPVYSEDAKRYYRHMFDKYTSIREQAGSSGNAGIDKLISAYSLRINDTDHLKGQQRNCTASQEETCSAESYIKMFKENGKGK